MQLTFAQLRDQIARARAGFQRLGVGPGDRVVAYLPNVPETLIAFAAAASLGAIWASCAPEFGARSVIDRFAQIEPKVLLAVGGYGWRDRYVDRRDEVQAIRDGLPSLEHVIDVPYGEDRVPDAVGWGELLPSRRRCSSTRSTSTIRCTSCSRRARPGCPRRSSTVTAGCSSSTSSPRRSCGT